MTGKIPMEAHSHVEYRNMSSVGICPLVLTGNFCPDSTWKMSAIIPYRTDKLIMISQSWGMYVAVICCGILDDCVVLWVLSLTRVF